MCCCNSLCVSIRYLESVCNGDMLEGSPGNRIVSFYTSKQLAVPIRQTNTTLHHSFYEENYILSSHWITHYLIFWFRFFILAIFWTNSYMVWDITMHTILQTKISNIFNNVLHAWDWCCNLCKCKYQILFKVSLWGPWCDVQMLV